MKKIVLVVGAVVIALAIAAGSFYGGMAYQRSQANAVRDRFLSERGLEGMNPGSGNLPGPGQEGARGAGGGAFGGGMAGQVKSIAGNTLTLSTPQNETQVTVSDTTSILKNTAGTLADLQPGQQVMITGERDADGNMSAVQIVILGDGQPAPETTQ